MKWVKLAPLLLLALAIDGFQFLISIGLSIIAAFPATAGGCAVGGYIAGGIGCFVIGVLGSFPIFNASLATVTVPIGMVLGFAITICISFTLGSMLVLFLQLSGMLDKKAAVMAYIGETIPGLSMLPAWTTLVVRCAMKELKGDVIGKTMLGGAVALGNKLVLPNTAVGNAMRAGTLNSRATIVQAQPTYQPQQPEERPEGPRTPPMQDMRIRPRRAVNDNPRPVPKAANDDFKPYAQAA